MDIFFSLFFQRGRKCKPIFVQIARQVVKLNASDLRLPSRAWKVKLVGEGADDAGGVFDDTITEMCQVFQMKLYSFYCFSVILKILSHPYVHMGLWFSNWASWHISGVTCSGWATQQCKCWYAGAQHSSPEQQAGLLQLYREGPTRPSWTTWCYFSGLFSGTTCK